MVPPGFGPNSTGSLSDFFPGLVYADALAMDVEATGGRFRTDSILSALGVGKPIGLGLNGKIPPASLFTQQPDWAWFLVCATSAQAADQADPLRQLYADPRIVALPVAPAAN